MQPSDHPLRQFSATFSDSSYISEVDCLLPQDAGQPAKTSRHAHHRSFSQHLATKITAFSVAMQPRKGDVAIEGQQETVDAEAVSEEVHFPDAAETREWLYNAALMLPKVSWGWLPFGFTFLGFGPASKLLLFITAFAVYCSALMYRLYQHTEVAHSLADLGQEAFGRFGRRLVNSFTLAINVALPVVAHVGGMRYLQHFLFASTGVCLPWISLMFGAVVLGLGQIQRLGRHPKLGTVVVPALTACAVGLTIAQLLLLRAAHAAAPPPPQEEGLVYLSDYTMAVVSLISANYFGQHTFLETMTSMEHPATFQHSTATAQVATLLMNAAIGLASLSIPTLKVRGFITFAFNSSEPLPRVINFFMFAIMVLKYVQVLNILTHDLIPWLPHLMQQVVDPSGVESDVAIKPRQLWLLASSMVVAFSYIISNTFPHTFFGLTGLLTSLCYIPCAYILPCVLTISLLSHSMSALEYTLVTWIIPVSLIMSLVGVWSSTYHLISKWHQYGDAAGCWGCNAI